MDCEELQKAMARLGVCEVTDFGTKLVTHCLYPSFDVVAVYVSRWGDGYRVSDGGGAVHSVLAHGRDDAAVKSAFKKACLSHSLIVKKGVIESEVSGEEWVPSAVLAVANASATVASIAVQTIKETAEKNLGSLIYNELVKATLPKFIASNYEYKGVSGKTWHIDYAVLGKKALLVKAVTSHHNSISSNYTTYGDIAAANGASRFSVYETNLEQEDSALLRQVADLVPLTSLEAGVRREVAGFH